ncbi:MAG: tRNA uridine-5-carboxymethylaminomethyl(34) synthesis GTPase MnmE [Prevotella sp.]|nr:tRNA uridine-5-carboxymethylaminomethyl(34) synthesis GTPase MnmE [Prevotella sp.]
MKDTICALATAPGGALGIIRISGAQALEILSRIFSKDLTAVQANTIHYGHIVERDERVAVPQQHATVVDEVLVSVFRAPHSYTGEDSAEISCHGSSYILNKVLELLCQHGCRMAQPGEFTMRAYLNGKMDLSQAEAVADLIASTNKATHQLAMSQLRGGISTALGQLREQLLNLTSLLELELDFSDHEDLEFADRAKLLQLAETIDAHISRLAETFQTGNALKNGIPVAIVGAPNVGKSTLLNALLGEERAIVSDIQGTTRDAIEDTIQLGGITFRFIDTAGIRHTDDTIENLGIERTIAAAQRAQVILLMTEPGVPYPDIPIRADQTVIRIENKADLSPVCGDCVATSPTLSISAKHGIDLDLLRQQLLAAVPQASDSDIIVTNARHYEALTRALESIRRVINGLQQQLSGDLLSEDLRLTLDALSEITGGLITPQETLNTIFSHFCVGK